MIRNYSTRVVFIMIGLSLISVFIASRQFIIFKDKIYSDTLEELAKK